MRAAEGESLLTFTDGSALRAKLVIGADGASSQVRQMAGIGTTPGSTRSPAC
ncbi:2-octaprenyl-3-methyl-6-methoxy-1,4-benzoquinol hydroxylase [Pluralibacter gergoviae]|nr:2-octaprenyl-3-methyl-6-methoxy-1,4-benzoquinol hydroxylase [Pluralibacter gergoviae]